MYAFTSNGPHVDDELRVYGWVGDGSSPFLHPEEVCSGGNRSTEGAWHVLNRLLRTALLGCTLIGTTLATSPAFHPGPKQPTTYHFDYDIYCR